MRTDQFEKMLDLREKLVDVFLMESDPDNFPGAGKPMREWTREERGDRFWSKRNAAMTLTTIVKLSTLVDIERKRGGDLVPGDEDGVQDGDEEDNLVERDIERMEREARKLLEKAASRAGKP